MSIVTLLVQSQEIKKVTDPAVVENTGQVAKQNALKKKKELEKRRIEAIRQLQLDHSAVGAYLKLKNFTNEKIPCKYLELSKSECDAS